MPLLALGIAWWLTVWVSLPVAFFWSQCPCCCCACSGNNEADDYQIDLTGMANADCTGCSAVNGTYIVNGMTNLGGEPCVIRGTEANTTGFGPCTNRVDCFEAVWILTFSKPAAGNGTIKVFMEALCLDIGIGRGDFQWNKTDYTGCIDETTDGSGGCLFSALAIPDFSYSGSPASCDGSGSTLTLTAI